MSKRLIIDPETRVGNCAGCSGFPRQLHKMPGIYRYRCAGCYKREQGHFPHTATPAEINQAICTCDHARAGEHASWCASAPGASTP